MNPQRLPNSASQCVITPLLCFSVEYLSPFHKSTPLALSVMQLGLSLFSLFSQERHIFCLPADNSITFSVAKILIRIYAEGCSKFGCIQNFVPEYVLLRIQQVSGSKVKPAAEHHYCGVSWFLFALYCSRTD